MFLLPNDKQIDDEQVRAAMEDSDQGHFYFLNTETGEVDFVSEMTDDHTRERLDQIETDTRLIPIPKIPSHDQYQWMEDFNEKFVKRRDKLLYEKLAIALNSRGAFRRFKDVLTGHKDGDFLFEWYHWREERLIQMLYDWFEGLPMKVREEPDRWDGSPCCASHGDEDHVSDPDDGTPF